MDALPRLLFELSNEYRMDILLRLKDEPLRLSHLSEKVKLAVQETSRHLSRLSDACLITKDPDGLYHLTPYGAHTVMLLPGYQFLAKNGHYFMSHTLSYLPPEMFARIGELSDARYTPEVMTMFHEGEQLIRGAKEYVLVISDQVLMSAVPLLHDAARRKVLLNVILPEDLDPPKEFVPWQGDAEYVKRRVIGTVDIFMTVTERGAVIAFPTWNRSPDHVGFCTTDERGRAWCKDTFTHYWERAKPGLPKGFPPLP